MKPTVEIFCPFSLGEEQMEESGFFPVREDGWTEHAIIVDPDVESIVYHVRIPGFVEEVKGRAILGSPFKILRAGEVIFVAEEYVEDDKGFYGYPYVTRIRQQ